MIKNSSELGVMGSESQTFLVWGRPVWGSRSFSFYSAIRIPQSIKKHLTDKGKLI
jgi:hypothetical protein